LHTIKLSGNIFEMIRTFPKYDTYNVSTKNIIHVEGIVNSKKDIEPNINFEGSVLEEIREYFNNRAII
jgi:hypothetical protein